ncbi:type IX secretion system membrane protein PorP/SprF [Arenibacter sp. F20364]|uniref:PorP/SprF family type IX secretion system membrane protein n=1 Tax=Arenibacter sp. F20364 TaxID=2926415 RepID=UPI001FF4676A|nr:type IX secretion system membrane protein PorP/SprF [Arenibacter sp. F20364]MCK0192542.1 type IX secretion system membrane protein PorP/SprF [Arenibacter sp. F20364]
MQNIKNIVSIALFLIFGWLSAQQEGLFTNYRYHMNAYNPAYVSPGGETAITSSYRQQWTGVEEAPRTIVVSFGTRLGEKKGLGVSVMNNKTFIESQTFIGIDYSYKLQLSEKSELYLGLKAVGNSYSVNTAGLETYNIQADPSISSISDFNPNIGAGILFKREALFFSLAMPRMLSTDRAENRNGTATATVAEPHLYATVGYDLPLGKGNLILKPSALMRQVSGAPISVDINTMLSFNNDFELGASYRTDSAFAGLVNLSLQKRLTLGFAYEVSTRSELASAKNTNELFLRFVF